MHCRPSGNNPGAVSIEMLFQNSGISLRDRASGMHPAVAHGLVNRPGCGLRSAENPREMPTRVVTIPGNSKALRH